MIPLPTALPLPQAQRTRTGQDTCECEKPKQRKPRAPRTTCLAGTYTQTSRGVTYKPTREVPCT